MQPSHFQTGLMTCLAVGLGYSLSSSDAVGYPSGAAVSYGALPVVSAGGMISGTGTETPLTASADQAIVITDLILSGSDTATSCTANTTFVISDGFSNLGRFAIGVTRDGRSYTAWESQLNVQMDSGIKIEAGRSLTIETTANYAYWCDDSTMELEYTLSGYYAQP